MWKIWTSRHASNASAQSLNPVAVDGEITKDQASHEPTQSLEPDAVGREVFDAILTIPTFNSKVVVTRTVHTRQ